MSKIHTGPFFIFAGISLLALQMLGVNIGILSRVGTVFLSSGLIYTFISLVSPDRQIESITRNPLWVYGATIGVISLLTGLCWH